MSRSEVFLIHPVFRRLARWLMLGGVLACGHTEPFTPPDTDNDQPFNPSPPVQLTFNQGPDRHPAWLPDGSGLLYSSQQLDTRDNDVCLGLLPPGGGSQRARTCTFSVNGDRITESLEPAAAQEDGRLAYVAATSGVDAVSPEDQSLVLATVADPITRTSLLSIPYTIPGRQSHLGISQLQWLSPDLLVYLGETVILQRPCELCPRDTLRSGLDAVSLRVDGGAPEAIPGTDNASGVARGSSADEIYFTLNGDTRVYRRVLSTGDVVVAHDFAGAGITRDVHVSAGRLTAVVGGRVHFVLDPALGAVQYDSGGVVHVLNLSDGSDVALVDNEGLYRRPRLSPEGTALVAERYPVNVILSPDGVSVDTVVTRNGDLYLFGQP
jgi:hypothetical protein